MKHKNIITYFIILLLFYGFTTKKENTYSVVTVIQTSKSGDKCAVKIKAELSKGIKNPSNQIILNPKIKYQEILGFGGAFTESSAYVLNQLSKEKREAVINSYFSASESAYSLTRTHINSCDFSLSNYSYAPVENDMELAHFSLKEDLNDLIPLIKDAQRSKGADFKIVASPWTAPPWMKDNNDWNDGVLLKKYYQTWANFFVKYITSYEEHGINIWGITVENEPMGNGGQWESMIFSPETMSDFVKNNLGPTFVRENINSKILLYDQNKDHIREWVTNTLNDTGLAKYVWGTALHWYSSTYEWYPEALSFVNNKYPQKKLLHTEACIDAEVPKWKDDLWYWSKEATDWGWEWAPEDQKYLHPKYVPVYRYARDIIGGLNNWIVGWIDWNIVLNDKGGPNHANNFCVAPVIVKPETNEIYYTPLFYIMRQFSKYIRPGAKRIDVQSGKLNLMLTAVQNPDNSIAVNILNQSNDKENYTITISDKNFTETIEGNCLQTLIIR